MKKLEASPIQEAGYIKIELSTKGKVGAPEVFHIRNFDTSDILKLAITEDEELPKKVSEVLDSLILEDDVSVKNFHEKEVIETLLRLYKSFFSDKLNDIEYNWDNEEDLKYLKSKYKNNPEMYNEMLSDLRSKRWVPKTSIDLNDVKVYEIPDDFKSDIYIKRKSTGLEASFTFPKFGDVLILKEFVRKKYKNRDKDYEKLKNMILFKQKEEERFRNGEEVNLSKLPHISEEDMRKYKEYEAEKAVFIADAVKALHLKSFCGTDLSDATLEEKMEYARDPRLDYAVMKKVNDYYNNWKIGVVPEVPLYNPIKETIELREYPFRLPVIFQALRLYEPDDIIVEPQ